jgi:uridine phosphorylase
MNNKTIYPCIRLGEGDLNPRVITVGDPDRAKRIAERKLENSVCVNKNREYHSYSGIYKGVPVSIVSHGVGCAGAAIAFESLFKIGTRIIIRVGTCGGLQEGIDAGKIVIATGACREDGVTDRIVPPGYPAICDTEVVNALLEAADKQNVDYEKGLILTKAIMYPSIMGSNTDVYIKAGVKALENEFAGLLILASIYNVKAGGVFAADAKAFELIDPNEYKPTQPSVKEAVDTQIDLALEAIINIKL